MSDPIIIGKLVDLSDDLSKVLSLTRIVAMASRAPGDRETDAMAALGDAIEERLGSAIVTLLGIIDAHGGQA